MSSDLLEFLEEDPNKSSLMMEMKASGTAFISILPDDFERNINHYILEPNESGIKNAEMIIQGIQGWIDHIKETRQ